MSRGPRWSAPSTGRGAWWPLALLAVVIYVPLLLTQPGWVSADTKSYLYLDPSRLLARAWSMWDSSIGLGTVSHQSIGYLWPMGPWFWLCEAIGLPDWLAQRLWWATLLWAAGAGVAYLLRRFDWPATAVWPAAFVYALSPYVLTHVGRLSGVLLPFVGLPWMVGLTVEAVRRGGWRHPALFALTVATVGSVNLTALLLVSIGPLLWLLHSWLSGHAQIRQLLAVTARITAITVAVNAWWIAGLSVQASNGIDVVRYSETAEVVANASVAQEVLRGLGYWFFYGGDRIGPWIEAGTPYTQEPWLIAASFALPVLALAVAAFTRWRDRSFAVALVGVGALVAIGAHPWSSGPPLGRLIERFLSTERGLAMRSLPRAVPLVALGLAVLAGAGAGVLARRHPRGALVSSVGVGLLAALALPALWQGDFVGSSLRRREVPDYWLEAIDAADAADDGTRVLELPGSDFAYYRWGTTIDPITPGLMDRPVVARELIPYGSPPAADLLNAFDRRLHERTLDPDAVAPIARLLRTGDLLVRSDLQFERFDLARPRLVWDLLADARGLDEPRGFGRPVTNEPVPRVQLQDEIWLTKERGLPDPPPVGLVAVDDVLPIVSTKSHGSMVLVDGSGDGIVDAASADLITGTELVRYTASFGEADLPAALRTAALVIVTDTARQRAERWRTVRDTAGYTERAGFEPIVEDDTDQRLPVFPGADASHRTVVEHRGGVTADATTYGDGSWYAPEVRPTAAIDGDPATAWRLGRHDDVRGERLVVTLDDPRAIDRVRLVQPTDGRSDRHLARVRVHLGGGPSVDVDLDESSRSGAGQLVLLPETTTDQVEVEILASSDGDRRRYDGAQTVGLAEVAIDDDPTLVVDEVVALPQDVLAVSDEVDGPLVLLLTRLRQDPTEAARDDEEPAIVRTLRIADDRAFELGGTARISGRAPDAVLDRLLAPPPPGVVFAGTPRLTGSLRARPAAAFDGDLATAWSSERERVADTGVSATFDEPVSLDHLDIDLVTDGAHSVPTTLEVAVDGVTVATTSVDPADRPSDTTRVPVSFPAVTGREVRVRATDVRPVTTFDRTADRRIPLPVAIAEVHLPSASSPAPRDLDSGCREDLLELDGEPLAVRVTGPADDALAGGPLDVEACGGPVLLTAGVHDLRATAGRRSGIDLDQLVLRDGALPSEVDVPAPQPTVRSSAPSRVRATLPEGVEREGTWLVLGESFNDGWRATVDGVDLGDPVLVDGFANGWPLPAGSEAAELTLEFAPQRRVSAGLLVSGVGVLVALALAWGRPPRPRVRSDAADLPQLASPLEPPAERPAWGSLVGLGVVSAIGAALVLPPLVAVGVGAAAMTAGRSRWARAALRLAPASLVTLASLYVVTGQLRHRYGPGSRWIDDVWRAHLVVVAAIVLLLVDLLVDRSRHRGAADGR